MGEQGKMKFIGSAKQVNDKFINGSICLDDIPPEDITASQKNGKRYINITVGKKSQPDQWQKTHYIIINEWKPEKKDGSQKVNLAQANDMPNDNVPF